MLSPAGLERWQFYGPSTRRGDVVHLFLVMRPDETVSVRGLPVRRVRRVRVTGTGHDLEFSTRTAILDSLTPDPEGEVTVQIPAADLDDLVTVLRVEIDPPPVAKG